MHDACVCARTSVVCTHRFVCICMYICTRTCPHIHVCVCMRTFVYLHTHTHTHTHRNTDQGRSQNHVQGMAARDASTPPRYTARSRARARALSLSFSLPCALSAPLSLPATFMHICIENTQKLPCKFFVPPSLSPVPLSRSLSLPATGSPTAQDYSCWWEKEEEEEEEEEEEREGNDDEEVSLSMTFQDERTIAFEECCFE